MGGGISALAGITYKTYTYYQDQTDLEYRNNFYQSINKDWLAKTEIPKKYSQYSNFHILFDENLKKTLNIAQNDQGLVGTIFKKTIKLFNDDSDQNSEYIKQRITDIHQISNKDQLMDEIINLSSKEGVDILFTIHMDVDSKGEMITPHISQNGLTFPEKKYYQTEDTVNKDKYNEYLHSLMNVYQQDDTEDTLFQFEKDYSETFHNSEDYNDPNITYNKILRKDVSETFGKNLLNKLNFDVVILDNKDLFSIIDDKINNTDLVIWKKYLVYKIIDNYSGFDCKMIREAHHKFYDQYILGKKEEKPINEKALDVVDSLVSDQMGKLFAEKYYSTDKNTILTSICNLIKIHFSDMINKSDLLGEETKKKAIEKITEIKLKLGNPDKYIDYSKLYENIKDKDELSFIEILNYWYQWKWEYKMSKKDTLPDKDLWNMGAHNVNAYYDLNNNQIVFPAGILQAPFLDETKSFSYNLGAIGLVIAHEISHSLDSQGCKYNKDGKLEEWWKEEEVTLFDERSAKIDEMFSKCLVQDKNLNGKLTLGENIADMIGLNLITDVQYMLDPNYKSQNWKDLFNSFGMVFRAQRTPAFEIMLLNLDPHSPPEYRTNLPLSNNKHFYKVYNITKDNKMWIDPAKQASIW